MTGNYCPSCGAGVRLSRPHRIGCPVGDPGMTHHEGCWREHHGCAVREIEQIRTQLLACNMAADGSSDTELLDEIKELQAIIAAYNTACLERCSMHATHYASARDVHVIADQRDAALQEIERLRAVLAATHRIYCTATYTDRGMHAPECLLYEIGG